MIAQSNYPLPTTPQLWKEGQFIYYFNHKDNGERVSADPMFSKDGDRYSAEFTILDSLDKPAIERAVTRAMADPELDRCVTDNIEVEAKPAIEVAKVYKPNASITSKISAILVDVEVMPVEVLYKCSVPPPQEGQ
jgi:hypothetical protein